MFLLFICLSMSHIGFINYTVILTVTAIAYSLIVTLAINCLRKYEHGLARVDR